MDSAISNIPLCFIHLMKTAGASTRAFIEAQFDVENICPAWNPEDFVIKSNEEMARYKLFAGHIRGSQLSKLPDITEFFTIVRDPANRIYSAYKWLRSLNNDYWDVVRNVGEMRNENIVVSAASKKKAARAWQLAKEYNFIDFIKNNDEALKPWATNLTLYQLACDGSNLSEFEDQNSHEIEIHYNRSMKILENCISVGVQENLQKSIELLCYKRNWPAPPMLPYIHRTDVVEKKYGDDEISIIQSRNIIDYKLYDAMLKRFNKDYFDLVNNAGGHNYINKFLNNRHIATVFDRLTLKKELELAAQYSWPGTGWGLRGFNKEGLFGRQIGGTGKASVLAKLLPSRNYNVKTYILESPEFYADFQLVFESKLCVHCGQNVGSDGAPATFLKLFTTPANAGFITAHFARFMRSRGM